MSNSSYNVWRYSCVWQCENEALINYAVICAKQNLEYIANDQPQHSKIRIDWKYKVQEPSEMLPGLLTEAIP